MRVGLRQRRSTGARDETKVRRVDIQVRNGRIRMVQHILGVHTNLETLRLGNLERLAEARIEAPPARSFDNTLAESSARSRQRVLQKHLAALRIRYCAERASGAKVL